MYIHTYKLYIYILYINIYMYSCVCVCYHSFMSDFLWPHALQPTRLLCPCNSPGMNTGVGCHFFLQGLVFILLRKLYVLMLLNCGAEEDSWESFGIARRSLNPKGNQPWILIGRTEVEAETPLLWPPDAKSWFIGKTLMLGSIEGRRTRGW